MDALKSFWENLKERIKTSWAEQQESPGFMAVKERFEELPSVGQKSVIWGFFSLIVLAILWWPLSNLIDASDSNSKFEERRQLLKELLKMERDAASAPNVGSSMPPMSLKGQFDQKIATAGVKPEQIKESTELPTTTVSGAQQKGMLYRIEHVTLRQAVDLGYELEHTDPGLRLSGFELAAEVKDPHFYVMLAKLISFSPKNADTFSPGKGLADAIKNKSARGGARDDSASPPPFIPNHGNMHGSNNAPPQNHMPPPVDNGAPPPDPGANGGNMGAPENNGAPPPPGMEGAPPGQPTGVNDPGMPGVALPPPGSGDNG